MKKIFTLLVLVCSTLMVFAEDYKCNLAVLVNSTAADPQQKIISATKQADGKYTLELKNFILYTQGAPLCVGNITVNDIDATNTGNINLHAEKAIMIEAGDEPEDEFWLGPLLCMSGPIDIVLDATITPTGILEAKLNIPYSEMDIEVFLKSSNAFQIPNSDFEGWHTATYKVSSLFTGEKTYTSDEPNAWHSFMSCTGSLASSVATTPHTFISYDELRPGTNGKTSVRIESGTVLGQSANGTITTGRLQAGSISASNNANCSFLDLTKTDVDGNGDPFHSILGSHPDALKLWVKYIPGNNADINATVSAVITDGTYYQDPENKTYTNVLAKAKNEAIKSNNNEWQELIVPFDYNYNSVDPKAILVTISTCAVPGGGSKSSSSPDVLYVDDLSLVYNSKLSDVKVFGESIENFSGDKFDYEVTVPSKPELSDIEAVVEGKGAFAVISMEANSATITSISEDFMEQNIYNINFTIDSTLNIDNVNGNNKCVAGFYNICGQKVNAADKPGAYILRKADGTSVKVVKK